MIVLPLLSDFLLFFLAGDSPPGWREYLRFTALPQDRPYPSRSATPHPAPIRGWSVQPPNTIAIFIRRPSYAGRIEPRLKFSQQLAL
jgi:hypothetical protein